MPRNDRKKQKAAWEPARGVRRIAAAGPATTMARSIVGPDLVPGARPSDPPPLHQLPEDTFEELCRDVFAAEPNVATCNRYGTRGERQLGIDLLAAVKNTADHHVAQCKCYQNFQPDEIKGASDAFLKHIDHWRAKRVIKR